MKPKTKDKIVAVKIIRNKKRFHAQALTEIKILEQLMQLVSCWLFKRKDVRNLYTV
jgi:hypothetical protein